MAETFQLRLLTPYRLVFEGPVQALILPGEGGEFGVLPRHTKFMTTLQPGILRLVADGQTSRYAVGGGFAEVHQQGVTVLADSLERPEDIDAARAGQSRDRALKELEDRAALDEKDLRRFEARLARAQNRLKLSGSA